MSEAFGKLDPPIGTVVNWFPDLNHREEDCQAAIVSKRLGSGILTLSLIPSNGGTITARRSVFHCSDKSLLDRPKVVTQSGVWDFMQKETAKNYSKGE